MCVGLVPGRGRKLLVQHLKKVDFLRGVAIILVFLFHCHLLFFDPNSSQNNILQHFTIKNILLNLSPSSIGWTGVPLFFIISGFLIHLGFTKNESTFKISTFFSKRFWRIYLPYWLTLVLFLAMQLFSGDGAAPTGRNDILFHVFTIYNFNDKYIYSINPSYWSLATEVQLYLIYPVMLLLRRLLGIRNCFLVICAISGCSLILGMIFNNFGTSYVYRYNPIQLWFIWAAGAYYAEAIYSKNLRILKKGSWVVLLALYLALIVSVQFHFTNNFSFYIATAACLVLFDGVLYSRVINIEKTLPKIVIFTGLCSYSFYLIHQPFLPQLLNFFGSGSASSLRMLSIVPAFVLILLTSYLLYKMVELPSIRLGKILRRG